MTSSLPSTVDADHPVSRLKKPTDSPTETPGSHEAGASHGSAIERYVQGAGQSGPLRPVQRTSATWNRGHRDRLRTKRLRDGCDTTCNRCRTHPQPGHRLRLRQFSGQSQFPRSGGQQECMDHPVDDGVADFPIGGASPRPRSEDRRPIDLKPGPQSVEGPLLELRNRPVGTRTDVDQEVAVLRDNIDEVADQPV